MKKTIGFVGLGKMGEPMARNLLRAGFRLRVYNRTSVKAQALAGEGAEVVATLRDVVTPDGVVVSMVANDHALEEVVHGDNGIGKVLGAGGVHISMSTVSPQIAQKLSAFIRNRGQAMWRPRCLAVLMPLPQRSSGSAWRAMPSPRTGRDRYWRHSGSRYSISGKIRKPRTW